MRIFALLSFFIVLLLSVAVNLVHTQHGTCGLLPAWRYERMAVRECPLFCKLRNAA